MFTYCVPGANGNKYYFSSKREYELAMDWVRRLSFLDAVVYVQNKQRYSLTDNHGEKLSDWEIRAAQCYAQCELRP